MNAAEIIEFHRLEAHDWGGYFKLIYRSNLNAEGDSRVCCSSIYFALTNDSPINHFFKQKSDVVHYFIRGCPIKYTVISPAGELSTTILGQDWKVGHQQHFIVPGNHWKMAELLPGSEEKDFGLICETLCPGFEYKDVSMATQEDIQKLRPADWKCLVRGIFSSSSS